MDVFSVGCVIAELFLESPIFTLSQLFKYRNGDYDPRLGTLGKIEDNDIRELVTHMIQVEPESRYSAEEYLNFWRRKAFPEYFYSFLHQYMGLITDPSSGRAPVEPETTNFGEADDRIDRVYFDFDKISYFLGYGNGKDSQDGAQVNDTITGEVLPVEIDIPNNRHAATSAGRKPVDDGTLIFLTLVVSALRNTARSLSRLRACDLMLAFGERITDEAKLDRILPYVVVLLTDRADAVKVAAIRTITQLVCSVQFQWMQLTCVALSCDCCLSGKRIRFYRIYQAALTKYGGGFRIKNQADCACGLRFLPWLTSTHFSSNSRHGASTESRRLDTYNRSRSGGWNRNERHVSEFIRCCQV